MEYPILCQQHNSPIALVNLNKGNVQNRLICFYCLENDCLWCPIENFVENPWKILSEYTNTTNQTSLFELIDKFENQIVEEYLGVEKKIQKLLLDIRQSVKSNLQTLKEIKSQVQKKKQTLYKDLELDLIVSSIRSLQYDANENLILTSVNEKLNEIFDENGQKLQNSLQNFELTLKIQDNKIDQFNNMSEKIKKDLQLIRNQYNDIVEKISPSFWYFQNQ